MSRYRLPFIMQILQSFNSISDTDYIARMNRDYAFGIFNMSYSVCYGAAIVVSPAQWLFVSRQKACTILLHPCLMTFFTNITSYFNISAWELKLQLLLAQVTCKVETPSHQWRCSDIDATLYKRHVLAGKVSGRDNTVKLLWQKWL